ncbi:MAG: hypothetical protein WD009_13625 [Phycisphaeraceae bacterium]
MLRLGDWMTGMAKWGVSRRGDTFAALGVGGLLLAAVGACQTAPPDDADGREAAGAARVNEIDRSPSTATYRHYQLQMQTVGPVPSAGLGLPRVSPDGRWIAWLEVDEAGAVDLQQLVTRNALEGVSLHVAPSDSPQRSRRLVDGGAWPAFSPDSRQLAAVARDEQGNERIVIHDLQSRRQQVIAPGLRHIQSLRYSPDGSTLAFSAHAPQLVRSRVYTLRIDTRSVTVGPASRAEAHHLAPQWLDDETLFVFAAFEQGVDLKVWPIEGDAMRFVGYTAIAPATAMGLHRALAGVDEPLDPSRRYLAYYDAREDRMVTLDLLAGVASPLADGTHALAWLDEESLLTTDGEDLLLYELPATQRPRELMGGLLLPRWGSWDAGQVLLLTPGGPGVFDLARLQIIDQR